MTNARRLILIRLLQLQGLIGLGVLLWIFFAGDRIDDSDQTRREIVIDTTTMTPDTIVVLPQKNHDIIVIKPSAPVLHQLASIIVPAKATLSEPPPRGNRVSAAIKVFLLAKVQDHYLLSGRDHWQKDLACDDLVLVQGFAVDQQMLAAALVCRHTAGAVAYDIAGRSLQADIVDLAMPSYRQRGNAIVISPQ